jgi:EpsI family protein
MAETRGDVSLETLVPRKIGDWRVDPTVVPIEVSPDVRAQLDKFYDQTLARTYVNSLGEKIMLSIAYGSDQSRSLQLHRPEVCYVAQGFSVSARVTTLISLELRTIPAVRLVAQMGRRNEPITYWMRVGNDFALSGPQQMLLRYRYGLSGQIPDGMLVRVSSIGWDREEQYRLQQAFIADLIEHAPQATLVRLVGPGRT